MIRFIVAKELIDLMVIEQIIQLSFRLVKDLQDSFQVTFLEPSYLDQINSQLLFLEELDLYLILIFLLIFKLHPQILVKLHPYTFLNSPWIEEYLLVICLLLTLSSLLLPSNLHPVIAWNACCTILSFVLLMDHLCLHLFLISFTFNENVLR